jgi:hypothetical protein
MLYYKYKLLRYLMNYYWLKLYCDEKMLHIFFFKCDNSIVKILIYLSVYLFNNRNKKINQLKYF